MGLRERNRVSAMRSTQRMAMQRFLDEGFADVTVESIAAEAGMAASTVFRHFGTKENMVLWDEHEIELERSLAKRLGRQPPLTALRDAFNETLAERYSADLDFQLQRIQYIYATTELHAAAVEADYRARADLTDALETSLSKPHRQNAALVAGAALLALDIAIGRWQASDAAKPLSKYINDAFSNLLRLEDIV